MAAEPEHETEGRERLIQEVGVAMQRYQRASDVLDQRLADHLGLNRTDLRCLELLLDPTPLSPGELATAAGLTTGGVTTAIDRLTAAGYATRSRDTADRRRVIVRPTEKCFAMVMEIYGPIVAEGSEYLRALDVTTLTRLIDFLRFATDQQHEHAGRLAERRKHAH
ncbi:MarR family winged helix-turn-helix transcriptional regulator [Streptomyces sp. NPDC052396]|uniref:MarR family winged helix-turn-helix transcriptional regulator n=1 Tax=Streptomyces sp. NPDC052396 TaxID=3365689 RepID=UPI0037D62AAB